MFNGVTSFNPDISYWDTSSVTNMQQVFCVATSFQTFPIHFGTGTELQYEEVRVSLGTERVELPHIVDTNRG